MEIVYKYQNNTYDTHLQYETLDVTDRLLQKTMDLDLVKSLIGQMEEEFMFWIENRTINVIVGDEEYLLVRYVSNISLPRPGKTKIPLYTP